MRLRGHLRHERNQPSFAARVASYEGTEYLRRVRELFLGFCDGDVVAVDATVGVEELAAEILGRVLAILGDS